MDVKNLFGFDVTREQGIGQISLYAIEKYDHAFNSNFNIPGIPRKLYDVGEKHREILDDCVKEFCDEYKISVETVLQRLVFPAFNCGSFVEYVDKIIYGPEILIY